MNSDWRDSAACRGTDTDLFFPDWAVGTAKQGIEQAKRLCRDCPVRAQCLDWALDRGVAFGIWGGFTEDERRTIRGTMIRRRLFPAGS
jgi:WhiB family transcriptional regulator, redox-sensing transcriptional regulator